MCQKMGIQHVLTTAYHPQSNGMVERVHRQLKDALRARGAGKDWHNHLPWVLLGLRAAPKEKSAVSSAELVVGSPLILPGQPLNVPEPPRAALEQPCTRPPTYAAVANTPPPHLRSADYVYVRRGGQLPPLADPYVGPFLVIQRGAKTFKLEIGGRTETISVDRLKAHTGPSPVSPAAAARRGRPAGQPATTT